MSGTITMSEAMARLEKFRTVDGLAEFLKKEGIKGIPTNTSECPLARWLKKATGRGVYGHASSFSCNGEHYPCSEAMAQFVHAFDSGKRYKFLQEK